MKPKEKFNKEYYQEFDVPEKIGNKSLNEIITFFLFNCPVEGKSMRGKTFEEYGFKGSKSFAYLKKKLLGCSETGLEKRYKPCKKDELERCLTEVEELGPPTEYCVFLKNDEKTIMQSLFSAIRNAFAHGSFNVKSYNGVRIYFLLNYNKYRKAQIVLHEETLLKWIDIVKAGYPPKRTEINGE